MKYVVQWPELILGLAIFSFMALICVQLFGITGALFALGIGIYWALRKPKEK